MNLARGVVLGLNVFSALGCHKHGYLSLFAPNCQANAEACETTGLSGAAAPGRGLDAEAAAAGLCLCYGVGAMAFKKRPEGGRGGGAKVIHMDTYGIYLDIYIIQVSSRASRWRKFQKKKELYSKERICL